MRRCRRPVDACWDMPRRWYLFWWFDGASQLDLHGVAGASEVSKKSSTRSRRTARRARWQAERKMHNRKRQRAIAYYAEGRQ